MSTAYQTLVLEIDRIVTSPYPTQLKSLRDFACTKCTESDIARWALSKSCQIERLAECLLDGLRQWPHVLGLVTRLSKETAIRDAIFQQCPTLLHDIVAQAVKAGSADSKYITAAVTLLSHPLPDQITMPSEAQTLFIRLFDQAADEPSLPNIRQVYQILQGTSDHLLGLLSSSSLLRLEQHLFAIIRNIKGENQSLSLYCLAIMKTVSSASDDAFRLSNSQYDTQELLASTDLTSTSKWTSDAIQQFFTDGKAQKTVQLVVLRAMWACTTSTGEPFDERMESLLLANEVISAISPHLREAWRKANSLIVGKLQDKVMSTALETELRFQGLCFLAQVAEGSRVPATVMDGLRGIVTDPNSLLQALSGGSAAQLERLMDAGVLDENTIMALLQQAVDFGHGSTEDHGLETLGCLQRLLQQIYEAMATDSKLSEGTMLSLDVISCGQKLHKLLDLVKYPAVVESANSPQACARAMREARCGLIHSLSKVFLRAALSSLHQSYSASQDTITLLLDLHANSTPSSMGCSHSRRPSKQPPPNFSFVEASSTPEDASLNWREAVQQHLQSRAQHDEHRLAALFAKACADLEGRCEEVEAPLQEEREKHRALQRQYDELQNAHSSLESEIADHSVRFNAVEIERDQYMNDLDSQREEIGSHERRVEELLQALQQARDEAEQSHRDDRSKIQAAELEHATASARKDEELEELQHRVQRAEGLVEESVAQLNASREELDQLQQSLRQAKDEMEDAHRLDAEHQDFIARLQHEKDTSTARVAEVSAELNAARSDAVAQREAFERDLSDLRQQADQDFASASKEHERKLADLTKRYEENAQALRKQLADVHEEVDQAREQHRADIEQWEAEIGEKQKKVDRLSRKCNEKDRQIAEANSMRTNLMAAMGFSGAQPPAQLLPHRPSRSSATQRTQYQQTDSQDDPSPPTPFSGDDSQQANVANASFASNTSGESRSGPTPKRPRPRKSIKAPSPAKPTTRLSVSTRSGTRASFAPQTGRSSVKVRQPLLGVSGNQNRLQVRPSLKTPSKGFAEDEDMFEGSEIFAGTQGLEAMDLGAALDEETETGL